MAIGDIKLREGASIQAGQSPRVVEGAFGSGVARALGSLANSFDDAANTRLKMGETLKARQAKQDRFAAEEAYQRWVGEQNRAQAERLRNSEADGRGITNQSEAELEKARTDFLSTLPESVRDEYGSRLTNYVENQITSAFNFEFQQGNEFFRNTTKKSIDMYAAEILAGETSYEEAATNIGELIGSSDLPEAEKIALTDQAEQFIGRASFQKEMEFARNLKGTVREATGDDVVAAGLLPHERGILNAISARESGGKYNVRYGGADGAKTFDDYSKHPGIMETRPDGRKSSAAGRYQFTLSTWNMVAKELGLTDFSPESQDRAAIHLARKIYNRQAGAGELTFDQVLQSGDRDLIISMKNALTDENGGWEAFRHMKDDEFANIVMGAQGIRGGGTGSAELPDIWTDPRFDALSFEDKVKMANLGARQSDLIDKQQREAQQKAHAAEKEQMFLAATQGNFELKDEQELLKKGLLESAADVEKFRRVVNASAKLSSGVDRVTNALATGGPLTQTDNAALNKILGPGVIDGIRAGDEETAYGTVVPMAQRAGFIPSDASKELVGLLKGNDPAGRKYASRVLGDLFLSDPDILTRSTGMTKALQKEVALAATLRPYYTEDQVSQKMEELRDPKIGPQIETQRKAAAKLFDDEIKDSDITSAFESWLPFDEPGLPMDARQAAVLRNDMKQLFVEGYLVSGEESASMDYAAKMAQTRWGVSNLGGKRRILRDSPERFYPRINGEHDWLDQQVREEFNIPEGTEYQLVADAQTIQEGARYAQAEDKEGLHNASYQIAVMNEDGTVSMLLNDGGTPRRYYGEVTNELRNNAVNAGRYTNLVLRQNDLLSEQKLEGELPEDKAFELEEIQIQLEELKQGAPDGNPATIVPKRSVEQLEADLAREEEAAANYRKMEERGLLSVAGNPFDKKIEELKALIEKRKSNAGD